MKTPTTHYATLELAEHASPEAIRGAYRHLAQKWHPDKNPTNRLEATRITSRLNEAYAVLSHPTDKNDYDALLTEQRKGGSQGTRTPTTATPGSSPIEPRQESPRPHLAVAVKQNGSTIKGIRSRARATH